MKRAFGHSHLRFAALMIAGLLASGSISAQQDNNECDQINEMFVNSGQAVTPDSAAANSTEDNSNVAMSPELLSKCRSKAAIRQANLQQPGPKDRPAPKLPPQKYNLIENWPRPFPKEPDPHASDQLGFRNGYIPVERDDGYALLQSNSCSPEPAKSDHELTEEQRQERAEKLVAAEGDPRGDIQDGIRRKKKCLQQDEAHFLGFSVSNSDHMSGKSDSQRILRFMSLRHQPISTYLLLDSNYVKSGSLKIGTSLHFFLPMTNLPAIQKGGDGLFNVILSNGEKVEINPKTSAFVRGPVTDSSEAGPPKLSYRGSGMMISFSRVPKENIVTLQTQGKSCSVSTKDIIDLRQMGEGNEVVLKTADLDSIKRLTASTCKWK